MRCDGCRYPNNNLRWKYVVIKNRGKEELRFHLECYKAKIIEAILNNPKDRVILRDLLIKKSNKIFFHQNVKEASNG